MLRCSRPAGCRVLARLHSIVVGRRRRHPRTQRPAHPESGGSDPEGGPGRRSEGGCMKTYIATFYLETEGDESPYTHGTCTAVVEAANVVDAFEAFRALMRYAKANDELFAKVGRVCMES